MTQHKRMLYMEDFVCIICPIHKEFMVRASDHLGQNPEGIAYGCPKCEHYTNPNNQLGDQMTQHTKKLEQRKKEIQQEKLNQTVVNYEYQKGADQHFRKITYASGRVVTTDLRDKE